ADVYGTFTVATDGTIGGTTGALVASGSTIDFDLTKLAAVTIFGTDLQTAAGRQEQVGLANVVGVLLPFTDTVYLPAGTFRAADGNFTDVYGSFMVAANGSGALAVTGTSGAAVATGNTIHFNLCALDHVRLTPHTAVTR